MRVASYGEGVGGWTGEAGSLMLSADTSGGEELWRDYP